MAWTTKTTKRRMLQRNNRLWWRAKARKWPKCWIRKSSSQIESFLDLTYMAIAKCLGTMGGTEKHFHISDLNFLYQGCPMPLSVLPMWRMPIIQRGDCQIFLPKSKHQGIWTQGIKTVEPKPILVNQYISICQKRTKLSRGAPIRFSIKIVRQNLSKISKTFLWLFFGVSQTAETIPVTTSYPRKVGNSIKSGQTGWLSGWIDV